MRSAIPSSELRLPDRISAPIEVCVFICSNSASVSLPGFSRIASGIPILPMSCNVAARRISSISRWGKRGPVRQQRASAPEPPGVLLGIVVAVLGRKRKALQDLEPGLLQIAGALSHLLLKVRVLLKKPILNHMNVQQ